MNERVAVAERLWVRPIAGLFAGILAAAGVVFYLGISQRELIASLHGVAEEPLFLAALGGLVLMALQALRWWVVMRPVLPLDYGQSLKASDADDVCNRESLAQSFAASGYNVKKMLVELTQTDGFLYLGARE